MIKYKRRPIISNRVLIYGEDTEYEIYQHFSLNLRRKKKETRFMPLNDVNSVRERHVTISCNVIILLYR